MNEQGEKEHWSSTEFKAVSFGDGRLDKRFALLVESLAHGQSAPFCYRRADKTVASRRGKRAGCHRHQLGNQQDLCGE